MAARGSALSRAIRFFKEADLDECAFVLMRGEAIVSEREGRAGKTVKGKSAGRPRKAHKTNAAEQSEAQSADAN